MKRNYQKTEYGGAYFCCYHIVWCTIFRRPILTEAMRVRLKGVIRESCREQGVRLLNEQIQAERIILQVETTPKHTIHQVISRIRRNCASILRKEYPELLSRVPSVFTFSYFVSTEEKFPETKVAEWMEDQPRSAEAKAKRREREQGAWRKNETGTR